MAENKKGFILYADFIHILKHLTDEQAGLLFKHVLSYVNDENPVTDDPMVNLAFEPIKLQLKRDLQKYENIRERNRVNGAKGGRPKQPKKPSGLIRKPKKADNDTVNDNDTVTVNDINNRMAAFKNALHPFLGQYGKDMLNDFYRYWTEHNPKGVKMRYEYSKNQPFNIERRLITWKKRQKTVKPTEKEGIDVLLRRELNLDAQ